MMSKSPMGLDSVLRDVGEEKADNNRSRGRFEVIVVLMEKTTSWKF